MDSSFKDLSVRRLQLIYHLDYSIESVHRKIVSRGKTHVRWYFTQGGHRFVTYLFPALKTVSFTRNFDETSYSGGLISEFYGPLSCSRDQAKAYAAHWLKVEYSLPDRKLLPWAYFKLVYLMSKLEYWDLALLMGEAWGLLQA